MNLNQFNLDHIGIAVESLEESLKFYITCLGLKVSKIEVVPEQKVQVAFLETGQCHIELLEPTSEDSPIAKFLKKRGGGIHHIALKVSKLEELLEQMDKMGVKLIDKTPKKGADGKKIAFIHPKATGGVLLELCEEI